MLLKLFSFLMMSQFSYFSNYFLNIHFNLKKIFIFFFESYLYKINPNLVISNLKSFNRSTCSSMTPLTAATREMCTKRMES